MSDNISKLQQSFLKGSIPKNLDGFYQGKLEQLIPGNIVESLVSVISRFWLPWYGKEFNKRRQSGNNLLPPALLPLITVLFGNTTIVRQEKKGIHAFPFKTRKTKGLQDRTEVLELNYDLPENPPQIRNIVDEVVSLEENTYLGKAYTRKGGSPRLIAFFSLKK